MSLWGAINRVYGDSSSNTTPTTETGSGGSGMRKLPGETSAEYAARRKAAGPAAPDISIPFDKGVAYDFLLGSSPYLTSRQSPTPNQCRLYAVEGEPYIVRGEMEINDLSGGLDKMRVALGQGAFSNKLSHVDGLDHRHADTLHLAPLEESDTTSTKLMGNEQALHVAYVRGDTDGVIAGSGDTADQCLFRLENDSGANGHVMKVTALTYTPSSVIQSLAGIHQDTVTDRLMVGRTSGAPQILSALNNDAPTVDATMHASLTPCWGMINSPLNSTTQGAGTNIFYANNGIWTLSTTAGTGDAPTQVLEELPDGGYILGKLQIEGSVHRIYLFLPHEDLATTHVLEVTAGKMGYILSINFEGSDPQLLDLGLEVLTHALIWRDGIVGTDGLNVIWHNGQKINLGRSRARKNGSDRQTNIVSLAVVDDRLLAYVGETDGSSNVQGAWWEEYIPEENAWYRLTASIDPGTTTRPIVAYSGTTAVYHSVDPEEAATFGHRLFWYMPTGTESWRSITLLPSVVDPFYWQNLSEIRRYFATSGSGETPVYHLFSGFPKAVTDITYQGELKGEDSKVRVDIASQTGSAMSFSGNQYAEFKEDDDWRNHRWINPSPELLDRLQFKFTVTQGTSGTGVTRTTPNALPMTIGFYVYMDRQYRHPTEIASEQWRFINR